jgi:glutamate synthase (NADPH/NADH) small chain
MQIGRNVLVIGAGNTGIDCATIAKRLGADSVTIVYRRSEKEMSAYRHEYEFAKNEGIEFRFHATPSRVVVEDGKVTGLECGNFVLPGDQIVKAIGQVRPTLATLLGLNTQRGFIAVNADFETSLPGVYAGGDCVRAAGSCSTVMAVQDGKLAAAGMHKKLMEGSTNG